MDKHIFVQHIMEVWTAIKLFMINLFVLQIVSVQSQSGLKQVSQCFHEGGFSMVSLYCGYNEVIHVKQAYHGSHINPDIQHCSKLENDCIVNSMSKYNWSKCEGRHSCTQSVQPMKMKECDNNRPKALQYLQVIYSCLESTTEKVLTADKTFHRNIKRTSSNPIASKPIPVRQMCSNFTRQESIVMLESPGYPDYYMSGSDCRCVIKSTNASRIAITFHTLGLQMQRSLCHDWLLLQSPNYKDSTVVACGNLKKGMRTVESKSNWLLLHYHTARVEGHANADVALVNMPGFKIEIQSNNQKSSNLSMRCYTLDPSIIDNMAIKNGRVDMSTNLVLPASDWNKVSKPGPLSSLSNKLICDIWILIITSGLILCTLSRL